MREVDIHITTPDSKREAAARALGLDQPSAFDLAGSRSAYASDDAYIDAAVRAELDRNSPEYQAAYRRLSREYEQKQQAARRELDNRKFDEYLSAAKLSSVDVQQIDAQAVAEAKRDIAAGRVAASKMGDAIAEHARRLTEQRKHEIAAAHQMNEAIRSAARSGRTATGKIGTL